MAKTSLALILAVVFGVCTIGLLVSTIVLGTQWEPKKSEKSAETPEESFDTDLNTLGTGSMYGHADETNPCKGMKDEIGATAKNCTEAAVKEQAAANVTKGFIGTKDAEGREPLENYNNLCPVNVHWHLGAEHLSLGEYENPGKGPPIDSKGHHTRRLAKDGTDLGRRCNLYDENDKKFTTDYNWRFCDKSMKVGETYEFHWPHSTAGACKTVWQYQTPFLDGLFCKLDNLGEVHESIGVQGQVFVIVNDDNYYYPNLMDGMIVDETRGVGVDIAKYTGSSTGPSYNNDICSMWAPITWHVDRKCHLISASSIDKLCYDMMNQAVDMSDDIYAHGSRIVVAENLTADNMKRE